MMSQEEILPWSEPDTNFFADNLLGIEDWGDTLTDIKLGQNDVLLGDKDQDMEVNTDDLSELLQNIGDDMWAISEDTVKCLGSQIKQEPPPSPSSSTSSLISLDSSLPSSPESQLLMNGQHSPPYHTTNTDQVPQLKPHPIKTDASLSPPPSCIRTEASLTLPPSVKTVRANIKTESKPTPSCSIKKEAITIQPCSLAKPLQSIPAGQVQKIMIQNGQIPKIISQGTATTCSSGNITYIPVSGAIPTNAIIVNKQGTAIPKPITTAISNGATAVKPQQNSVINEKLLRRQQRMIKNRESACLSRKKKKEYLQSLENQVKEVTKLNDMLNDENTKLKKKVQELEKENILLKSSHPDWSSTAKKSTCVLAIVLLVALNVGPFSNLKDSWKFNSPDLLTSSVRHGRALLQYEGDDASSSSGNKPLVYGSLRKQHTRHAQDTLNGKTQDNVITMKTERKDLIVVKNKWDFLADINKKKFLLAKRERRMRNTMKRMNRQRKTKVIEDTVCPSLKVNATESIRINEALGDWMHRYQVEKSSRQQQKNSVQYNKFKSKVKQLALRLAPNCTEAETRRRVTRHMFTRRHNAHSSTTSTSKNAVQLFQGPDWLELFSKAINRQEDTMYIVSFRKDHLVFPATKSNVTERPKMSLMMMAPPNGTRVNVTKDQDFISMIQIDCQVMDTKHVNIKKSSLPIPFADGTHLYNPSPQGYTKPPPASPPSLPTHNAK